jgi:hypothetical protein
LGPAPPKVDLADEEGPAPPKAGPADEESKMHYIFLGALYNFYVLLLFLAYLNGMHTLTNRLMKKAPHLLRRVLLMKRVKCIIFKIISN